MVNFKLPSNNIILDATFPLQGAKKKKKKKAVILSAGFVFQTESLKALK
jgi:hypothetical protein